GGLRHILGVAQLLLGPLSLGHVTDEGGEQVLLAQADGGNADFGGELTAVAAQGRDLDDAVEQRPPPGRQEANQAGAMSFAELRGDDGFGQDAANHLGPRPAEGDLGMAVPLGDAAVGAHGDEGVVGVVEDEALALLASPQLGFDLPEVGDVGTGPKPFYDVSFAIPHGSAAGLEPAVHAVRTADAVFHVVGATTCHRVGPEPPGRLTVVRVERRQPAPAQQVALRHPGMLSPLRAEVVTGAVGRGAPDQLRQRLGQASPTLLALAERLLKLFAGRDVGASPEPFADRTRAVPDRYAARSEPAILPV